MVQFKIGQMVRRIAGDRETLFEVVSLPVASTFDGRGDVNVPGDYRLGVKYADNPSEVRRVDPTLYEPVADVPRASDKPGKTARELGGES